QDGYIDLAVANSADNDVSILINDTQTTFTGRLLDLASNSSNTALSTLVQITNDNTGATGTTALTIQQDGGGTAILITGASILHAIDASENNITNAINVGSNTITGTTAVIDFTNFDVSAAGQVTIGSFGGATATTVCENSGLLSACSSSIRYKEEVLDLTAGLDIIQQLRPVSFNWIGREEPDLGFIAEEVAAIYPLLITYVDEQIEGVKYKQLTAILVNAINEQQEEIIAVADLVGVDLSALTIENAETEEVLAESLLSRVDSLGARLTSLEEQGLVAGETTDNDAAGSDEPLPTTPDDLQSNEIFWQDIAITGLLTVENNADILGELTVRSDVTLYADLIVDTIYLADALFVHGDTTLFGNLLVEGDVEVTGALSRSNEQVGEVTIPEGQQWAQISFNQSFLGVPTVNVTSDDSTVSYTVSDVTAAGFTVTLTGEEPGKDTQFSWYALVALEDGSTVEYGGEFETDEVPTDDSEETNTTAEGESTPEAGSDDVVQVDIEEIIIEDLPGLEIILGG
ncbi:tail fiber domain-containing protein, partial [Patescibacteria group bacterium]|nr:tail fiber domain-containing protein [Patescibacteria group bacterium]